MVEEAWITSLTVDGNADGQAASVSALRQALMAGTGLGGVLESVARALPFAFGAMFAVVARSRFGPRPDIRRVTAYISMVGARGIVDFRPREAEAIVRVALGEAELERHVDRGTGLDNLIARTLINDTFEDRALSSEEVRELFDAVSLALREGSALHRPLELAASQWDRACAQLAVADESIGETVHGDF
jgi:hypothetical protein